MFEKIQDSINNLLEEINDINKRLKIRPSLLDVDLVNQKIIQLYDLTNLLQRDLKNAGEKPVADNFVEEKIKEEKPETEKVKEEIKPEPVSELPKEITDAEEDISEEQEVATEENPINDEENVEESVQPETMKDEDELEKEPEPVKPPIILVEEKIEEKTDKVQKPEKEEVKEEVKEEAIKQTPKSEVQEAQEELPSLFSEGYYTKKTDLDLYNEDKPKDKKPIHEKFAKEDTSLNKKLTANENQKLSDKLQKGPITDIKSAINLNLKLSFIKELYQGDQKEYKKMIDFLGKCKNYSEARFYITKEQEGRPYWVNKSELVNTLMGLIERRFRADD